jgi:hypothetical protein
MILLATGSKKAVDPSDAKEIPWKHGLGTKKNHHAERGGFLGVPSPSLKRRLGSRKRPRCDAHRLVVAKIPFRRKRK